MYRQATDFLQNFAFPKAVFGLMIRWRKNKWKWIKRFQNLVFPTQGSKISCAFVNFNRSTILEQFSCFIFYLFLLQMSEWICKFENVQLTDFRISHTWDKFYFMFLEISWISNSFSFVCFRNVSEMLLFPRLSKQHLKNEILIVCI